MVHLILGINSDSSSEHHKPTTLSKLGAIRSLEINARWFSSRKPTHFLSILLYNVMSRYDSNMAGVRFSKMYINQLTMSQCHKSTTETRLATNLHGDVYKRQPDSWTYGFSPYWVALVPHSKRRAKEKNVLLLASPCLSVCPHVTSQPFNGLPRNVTLGTLLKHRHVSVSGHSDNNGGKVTWTLMCILSVTH